MISLWSEDGRTHEVKKLFSKGRKEKRWAKS